MKGKGQIKLQNYLFIKEFLSNPLKIGAIRTSSTGLTKLITDTADLKSKKCVVEFGPGTSVFTKEILHKITPECTFFCLEINEKFVEIIKKKCPNTTVYNDSAENINYYLSKHQQKNCDCIISGLPWAAFNDKLQRKLMSATHEALEEGGVFLTMAYIQGDLMPSGLRFKRLLEETFTTVEKTRVVWRNLPPAFVYHCRK